MPNNTLFSLFKVSVDVADDSSLAEPLAHGAATVTQNRDNKSFVNKYQVFPGQSEQLIDFSTTLTLGYRWAIFSDYPILIRANGPSATQLTLASGNVAATNVGAPLPYQCVHVSTSQITSLRLAPIVGASQLANVKVIIIGDPTNAYT